MPKKDTSTGLRKMVVSRKGVLRGTPCLRGTRLSVFIVAGIARECGIDEVLDTYPHITRTQVRVAIAYADAHPDQKPAPPPDLGRLISRKVGKVKKVAV